MRGDVLRKKTPIMFSSRFFLNLRRAMYLELPRQLRISWPDKDFFVEGSLGNHFADFHGPGYRARHQTAPPEAARDAKVALCGPKTVCGRPDVCTSILSALYGLMPAIWKLLLWAVAGISLSRLAGGITADHWKRRSIYGLAAVVIINQLLDVIGVPQAFLRVYVFLIALAGFLFFLWRSVKTVRDGSSTLYRWVLRLAALLLLVVFIAEIIGQTVFAMQVFDATIRSVFFVLLGWMLITLIRGALELVVKSSVFQRVYFLKENADVILRRLMLLVQILYLGFYLCQYSGGLGDLQSPDGCHPRISDLMASL